MIKIRDWVTDPDDFAKLKWAWDFFECDEMKFYENGVCVHIMRR